jgi:ectoine hydroxylase-related dioxygenase (phytanoyl-CoA dioxygenase family)
MQGMLTGRERTIVHDFFDQNGYYIFRNVLPKEAIDAVHVCLEKEIYPSPAPFLRHPSITKEPHAHGTMVDGTKFVSNALYNPHLELETANLGKAIIHLACGVETAECLAAINDEQMHTMHQAIVFFVSPGTEPHIDGWALDTVPPGRFLTMWIPLEPITLHNGPVGVFPWPREKFLSPEMLGIEVSEKDSRASYGRYHDALIRYLRDNGIGCVVPPLDPGDFIVFSSITPHATMPRLHEHFRRMALQILVRPSSSRWGGILMSRLDGHAMNGDPDSATDVNERWRALSA